MDLVDIPVESIGNDLQNMENLRRIAIEKIKYMFNDRFLFTHFSSFLFKRTNRAKTSSTTIWVNGM